MMNKKKSIANVLFLIAVFGLTIYGVFHGQNLGELLSYIKIGRASCRERV